MIDVDGKFARRCNREMVDLEPLLEADDVDFVQVAIMKHVTLTGSRYAETLLRDWASVQKRLVKVMPREYRKALAAESKRRATEERVDPVVAVVAKAETTRRKGHEAAVHG